jgi:hypothetical protein
MTGAGGARAVLAQMNNGQFVEAALKLCAGGS